MVVSCEMKWHSNVSGHVASYREEPSSSLWVRTPAGIIIHLSLGSNRAIAISKTWISDPTIILVFLYFFFCFVQFYIIVLHVLMSHFIAMTKGSSPSSLGYLKPTVQNLHMAQPSARKSSWYPHSASMPSWDDRSSFSPFWAEKKLATYFPPIKTLRSFQWWLGAWQQDFIFFQVLNCQKGKEF